MQLTKLKASSLKSEILKLINFYLKKLVYGSKPLKNTRETKLGIDKFLLDFSLRKKNFLKNDFFDQIKYTRSGLLPVLLYRIAKENVKSGLNVSKSLVCLSRILCVVEIYLDSEIGYGFNIDHGYGSIIGSRSKIGNFFLMHSNCIIGHNLSKNLKRGPIILNNVTMCANSMVIGPVKVKNNYTVKPFEIYS